MGLMVTGASILGAGAGTSYLNSEGSFPTIITITGAEVNEQYVAPKSGTLSRFKGRMRTNTLDAAMTITLRINGVGSAITAVILAGDASSFDIAGSLAVSEGDLISWEAVVGGVVGQIDDLVISYDFN